MPCYWRTWRNYDGHRTLKQRRLDSRTASPSPDGKRTWTYGSYCCQIVGPWCRRNGSNDCGYGGTIRVGGMVMLGEVLVALVMVRVMLLVLVQGEELVLLVC